MRASHCITFNYDVFLDQALAATLDWSPLGGYGFHCPSSLNVVGAIDEGISGHGLLLLKLHGSVNWRPRLGHANPVPIDAITHHDDWSGLGGTRHPQVAKHLEPQPVIVPPVLSKSSLVEQPVLRLVWSLAFKVLEAAHEVTFVGYSIPTDMAARTLFSEALKDLPKRDIRVVNLANRDSEVSEVRKRYQDVLGDIPDTQFHFGGARAWIGELPPA